MSKRMRSGEASRAESENPGVIDHLADDGQALLACQSRAQTLPHIIMVHGKKNFFGHYALVGLGVVDGIERPASLSVDDRPSFFQFQQGRGYPAPTLPRRGKTFKNLLKS